MENTNYLYMLEPKASIIINGSRIKVKDLKEETPLLITAPSRVCASVLFLLSISKAYNTPPRHISINYHDVLQLIER